MANRVRVFSRFPQCYRNSVGEWVGQVEFGVMDPGGEDLDRELGVAYFEFEPSGDPDGERICSLSIPAGCFGVLVQLADVFAGLSSLDTLGLFWSIDEVAAFLVSFGFVELSL